MQINVFQYLYIILLTFAKVLQKLPDCKKISTEHCIDYYNHLITNRLPRHLTTPQQPSIVSVSTIAYCSQNKKCVSLHLKYKDERYV